MGQKQNGTRTSDRPGDVEAGLRVKDVGGLVERPAPVGTPGVLGSADEDESAPDYFRSVSSTVSTIDSGCCQDGDDDLDDDDTVSTSSFSSSGSEEPSDQLATQVVSQVMQQVVGDAKLPKVSFNGDISVENSSRVQFGNNTHIHGPVTVVVSSSQTIAGIKLPEDGGQDQLQDQVVAALKAEALRADGAPPASPAGPHPPEPPEEKKLDLKRFFQWPNAGALLAVVVALASVTVVAVVVIITTRITDPSVVPEAPTSPAYPSSPSQPSTERPAPTGITLVKRQSWLAQPPNHPPDPLATPVEYVVICHSASYPCFNVPECMLRTREIQMLHIESRGWDDIGYNFLVGGDGYVYEGRGWGAIGAFVQFWNSRAIGLCMIGTFTLVKPEKAQTQAIRRIIEWGVKLGQIREDYKLVAACQLQPNKSPGRQVWTDMKTWPHWFNGTGRECTE